MAKKGLIIKNRMSNPDECPKTEAYLKDSPDCSELEEDRQKFGGLTPGAIYTVQRLFSNSDKHTDPFFTFDIKIIEDDDYGIPSIPSVRENPERGESKYMWEYMKYLACDKKQEGEGEKQEGKKYFVKPAEGTYDLTKALPGKVFPFTHHAIGYFSVICNDGKVIRKYYVYDFLDKGSLEKIVLQSYDDNKNNCPYFGIKEEDRYAIISSAFLSEMFYIREMILYGKENNNKLPGHFLDLKLENILVLLNGKKYVCKASDFETVVFAENFFNIGISRRPCWAATYDFAAPVMGLNPDKIKIDNYNRLASFSDIFSAGIILLALCTGKNNWYVDLKNNITEATDVRTVNRILASYYYPDGASEDPLYPNVWTGHEIEPDDLKYLPRDCRKDIAELIKAMLRIPYSVSDGKPTTEDFCYWIINRFCEVMSDYIPEYLEIPKCYMNAKSGKASETSVPVSVKRNYSRRYFDVFNGEILNVPLSFYDDAVRRKKCKGLYLINRNGKIYYYLTPEFDKYSIRVYVKKDGIEYKDIPAEYFSELEPGTEVNLILTWSGVTYEFTLKKEK